MPAQLLPLVVNFTPNGRGLIRSAQGNVSFGTDELAKTSTLSLGAVNVNEIVLDFHGPVMCHYVIFEGPGQFKLATAYCYPLNATQLQCVREAVDNGGTYDNFPPSTHYFTVSLVKQS